VPHPPPLGTAEEMLRFSNIPVNEESDNTLQPRKIKQVYCGKAKNASEIVQLSLEELNELT
jgi:hypothetical protein